jgi:hypothetical protein
MGRSIHAVACVSTAILLAVATLALPARGVPSAAAQSPACPSSPVTIGKLVDLEMPGNVCYGSSLLTFNAYVPQLEGLGGTSTYEIRPAWLDDLSGSWVALGTSPRAAMLTAYVPPDLGRCLGPVGATCPFRWYRDGWAKVSGHFDGAVAQTCRYISYVPDPTLTKKTAVRECQQKFIVLSVGPADTLPETDTVAAGDPHPVRPTTPLPWLVASTVGWLLLIASRPAWRRRDRIGGVPGPAEPSRPERRPRGMASVLQAGGEAGER